MTFTGDLKKFEKKTGSTMDTVIRKIVIDVGKKLVYRSPVGDPAYWSMPAPEGYAGGRFRANWQYSFGSPATSTIDAIDPDGSLTVQNISDAIGIGKTSGVHFITNNVDYGIDIENGRSRQAPRGVVGLTVVEFEGLVKSVAKHEFS